MVTFTCPDKMFVKCFKTERGLAGHLAKSAGCAKALEKFAYCLPVGTNIKTQTQAQEQQPESEEQDDEAIIPIDVDNTSDNEESNNIVTVDDNNENNIIDNGVDNTICYTTEIFNKQS